MEKPKLHWMVYSIIRHNISDKMVNVYKAVHTTASWDLSIYIGINLLNELDRWKNSCLMPLTDTINE